MILFKQEETEQTEEWKFSVNSVSSCSIPDLQDYRQARMPDATSQRCFLSV